MISMQQNEASPASPAPSVLFIGGHDPTGGAGIQADIEAAIAHQCRAYALVTCLTAQDSHNVHAIYAQQAEHFRAQATALLNDITPDWIKLGMIGDIGLAQEITHLVRQIKKPVVFDPVLAAGGGHALASDVLIDQFRQHILPLTDLLTPNRAEARRLTGQHDLQAAVADLLACGCHYVLLTGADESQGGQVINTLYGAGDARHFTWPKLPHVYHGSGCTLASACACQLAHGAPIEEAVYTAQAFTWRSLRDAEQTGSGQHLPRRLT